MDKTHVDDWSAADLAARLTGATSSDLSIVLRIISARLAALAHTTTDPGSVLGDIRRTLESLQAATRIILVEFQCFNDAGIDAGIDAVDGMSSAIGAIHSIAENI